MKTEDGLGSAGGTPITSGVAESEDSGTTLHTFPTSFLLACLTLPLLACSPPAWKAHRNPGLPLSHELVLSVQVDGDSLLPYEPICAIVSISNVSSRSVTLELSPYESPNEPYELSVMTAEQVALSDGRMGVCLDYGFQTPAPIYCTIRAGQTVSDTHYLEGRVGILDTSGSAYYRLPSGEYRLRASWKPWVFRDDRTGEKDTAVFAPFVVRVPSPREESAMVLYGAIQFFRHSSYWNEPRSLFPHARYQGTRRSIDSCASAILRDYPDVDPYAPLALKSLALAAHARRRSSPAWADSAAVAWLALMEHYPDTRTAAHALRARFLDIWAGKGAHVAALRNLDGRYPGTKVDKEVKRQLANLKP